MFSSGNYTYRNVVLSKAVFLTTHAESILEDNSVIQSTRRPPPLSLWIVSGCVAFLSRMQNRGLQTTANNSYTVARKDSITRLSAAAYCIGLAFLWVSL